MKDVKLLYDLNMIKFLPIIVLILLVAGAFWYLITRQQQTSSFAPTESQQSTSTQTNTGSLLPSLPNNSDQIKILQDAIVALTKKVNGETSTNIATLESRVGSLEDKVTTLQRQVSQLSAGITPTPAETATVVKKSPIYIPLGWVGSSSVLDWTTITTQTVIIDTNDYPGYSSAQFEGRIINYQGNGTCYARIINTTDGTAILGSEISATGTDYTWVTSPGFSLAQGKKTYAVQLKTNTGYAAQISDAHLKINF